MLELFRNIKHRRDRAGTLKSYRIVLRQIMDSPSELVNSSTYSWNRILQQLQSKVHGSKSRTECIRIIL